MKLPNLPDLLSLAGVSRLLELTWTEETVSGYILEKKGAWGRRRWMRKRIVSEISPSPPLDEIQKLKERYSSDPEMDHSAADYVSLVIESPFCRQVPAEIGADEDPERWARDHLDNLLNIPIPLDEVSLDWEVKSTVANVKQVTYTVVRTEVVNRFMDAFLHAGFQVARVAFVERHADQNAVRPISQSLPIPTLNLRLAGNQWMEKVEEFLWRRVSRRVLVLCGTILLGSLSILSAADVFLQTAFENSLASSAISLQLTGSIRDLEERIDASQRELSNLAMPHRSIVAGTINDLSRILPSNAVLSSMKTELVSESGIRVRIVGSVAHASHLADVLQRFERSRIFSEVSLIHSSAAKDSRTRHDSSPDHMKFEIVLTRHLR